jgi:coenzyme Q-binding protein COQ10
MLTERKFSPGLKENPQSCIIDFAVSFEFRSLLNSQLAHVFFNAAVRQTEDVFIHDAANRFGEASVKTQRLANVSVNS